MKTKIITSILLVLIVTSGYCQKTYPAKQVINNDTVCVISIPQVKTLNKIFIERNYYRKMSDTLLSINYLYRDKIKAAGAIILNTKHEFTICDSLSAIQQKNDKQYLSTIAGLQWQNKKLKIYNTAMIATIVLLSLTKIFLK